MTICIIIIIGLGIICSKYKETDNYNHLYKRAFYYMGLQDNTNWWLGGEHAKKSTELSIFSSLIFVVGGMIQVSDSISKYDALIAISIMILGFFYLIWKWHKTTKGVFGGEYTVDEIRITMNDFRSHKTRLKELYDLKNVENPDVYLDNVIDEAEKQWIKAYNNGYY